MNKNSTAILERLPWKAIFSGIITFLALFFGFPEYVLNIRPQVEKAIGLPTLCHIEGAVLGAITVVLVLKFLSQRLQKKKNETITKKSRRPGYPE